MVLSWVLSKWLQDKTDQKLRVYESALSFLLNYNIVLLKTLSVPLFCQSSLTPLSSSHHPPKSCTNREKARCFVSKVPSRHLETLNHNLSQWEAQFVLFNAVCNCAIRYTGTIRAETQDWPTLSLSKNN